MSDLDFMFSSWLPPFVECKYNITDVENFARTENVRFVIVSP